MAYTCLAALARFLKTSLDGTEGYGVSKEKNGASEI